MAQAQLDSQLTNDSNLVISSLTGALGAEVRGFDLANLSDDEFETLHELLLQYSALAIHGQAHLSDEQLREFAMRWGELDVHGYSPTVKGHTDLLNIRSGPERAGTAEGWHSDISWKMIPPKFSMLLARQMPSAGGDTLFASQYRAYDELSDSMKAYLEPLEAEHDGRVFDIDLIKTPVRHPIVITHPETGRKALYVNRGFTARIPDLPHHEGRAILEFLFNHCTRERYQARLSYEIGTLSIWDNRCLQHCAPLDFGKEVRVLHRAAVLCDEPPSQ